MLTVIIPANNERDYIGACLGALLEQTLEAGAAGGVEVLVAANACTDGTVEIVEGYRTAFEARGWVLSVLDIPEGGKLNALNRADAVAQGEMRAYLDADVVLSPDLLRQLHAVLDVPEPRYASGRMTFAPAESLVTRLYGRTWKKLPFMQPEAVPGAGIFAVNGAGRARWGAFPDIISDDGYVRLMFAPEERTGVEAPYSWPLIEGWGPLVRVRRRQDAGRDELAAKYPELLDNESKAPMTKGDHLRLFLQDPPGYLTYVGVILAVRYGPRDPKAGWTRGR